MTQGNLRAETLVEALPHIQRYHGRTVIVKYGGAAMAAEDLSREVMRDIVLMRLVGIRPVVVHGGGPQVSQWMERLGAELARIQAEQPAARIRFLGPWPPYSFAEVPVPEGLPA